MFVRIYQGTYLQATNEHFCNIYTSIIRGKLYSALTHQRVIEPCISALFSGREKGVYGAFIVVPL